MQLMEGMGTVATATVLLSTVPKECTLHEHCLINSSQCSGNSVREVSMNYCQGTAECRIILRS